MKSVNPGHVRNAAKPVSLVMVRNAIIGTVPVLILGRAARHRPCLRGARRISRRLPCIIRLDNPHPLM